MFYYLLKLLIIFIWSILSKSGRVYFNLLLFYFKHNLSADCLNLRWMESEAARWSGLLLMRFCRAHLYRELDWCRILHAHPPAARHAVALVDLAKEFNSITRQITENVIKTRKNNSILYINYSFSFEVVNISNKLRNLPEESLLRIKI